MPGAGSRRCLRGEWREPGVVRTRMTSQQDRPGLPSGREPNQMRGAAARGAELSGTASLGRARVQPRPPLPNTHFLPEVYVDTEHPALDRSRASVGDVSRATTWPGSGSPRTEGRHMRRRKGCG